MRYRIIRYIKLYNPIAKKTFALLALFCAFLAFSQEQKISESFKKTADDLILKAPVIYSEIDIVLRPYRSDTILMRSFANLSAKKNYFPGQSYALNQLGTKYRNTSQYSAAIMLHKEALDVATKANNLELKVFSLNMLSVVYRRMDAIKTALDYAQEALELAETVENPSEGLKRSINVSLNGIGNIYQTLKQYTVAIETFKKSLSFEEKLNNKLGLAINNQNIGECYEELGQLNLALNYFRKSLAFNEEIDNNMGRVICNNSIAQVYIKQKKLQPALRILESTLKQSIALGDKYFTSSVYINLGWVLMELEQFEASEKNLLEGIRLAVKHNLNGSQATGYKLLSDLFAKQEDFAKSLEYYKKAKTIDEVLMNETNVRYVNDILFKYDTEKKKQSNTGSCP